MGRVQPTRRRYSTSLAAGLLAVLAGCTSGDQDNTDSDAEQDDDPEQEPGDDGDEADIEEAAEKYGPAGELTAILENEDGHPVSNGVEVQVMHVEEGVGAVTEEINDGVAEIELPEEGDYTVRAESSTDEFDAVEDEITVEGDEEITLILEGAPGDEDDSE